MSLQGKKALVTGGSRGIGAAIAKRLAADGASVAITYAGNKAAADGTVEAIASAGGAAFAFQADAADPASLRAGVEQAAAALGGIDILVHNAGIAVFSAVADDTDETYDRLFGVNVRGLHVGTRAALARGWAKDLAPRNILVNTIQPGLIDTDMNPADSELAQQMTGFVPLGRYGRVEEIAGVVSFLAGPDASYVTGTTLNIHGGFGA